MGFAVAHRHHVSVGGIYDVFFPSTAAHFIGWQVSPFQFEVGMADLALGATAVWAFWRDLSFKAAIVCAASIFMLGMPLATCGR